MKEYSLKKDFYERLREDYYMHRDSDNKDGLENSFIFQYMEQKAQANRKKNFRKNLEDNWETFKNGEISKFQHVKFIVERLSQSPKLYQECEDKDEKMFIAFLSFILDFAGAEKDGKGKKGTKKEIHNKIESLKGKIAESDRKVKKRIEEMPVKKLEQLTDRLRKIAVHIEVKTFFYDVGYPVYNTKVNTEYAGGKKGIGRKKKTENILSMLDEFCAGEKLSLSMVKEQELKEEEYEEFFDILAATKNEELFVPLQIDSKSGCGLFIVGKRYLYDEPQDSLKKKRQRKDGTKFADLSCFYVVSSLRFDDFTEDDIPYTFELDNFCITYHDAKEIYKEKCEHNGILKTQIQKNNSQWPEGYTCPSNLQCYFAEKKQVSVTKKRKVIPSKPMKNLKQEQIKTAKIVNEI